VTVGAIVDYARLFSFWWWAGLKDGLTSSQRLATPLTMGLSHHKWPWLTGPPSQGFWRERLQARGESRHVRTSTVVPPHPTLSFVHTCRWRIQLCRARNGLTAGHYGSTLEMGEHRCVGQLSQQAASQRGSDIVPRLDAAIRVAARWSAVFADRVNDGFLEC
jgi:hypothetical protein